MFKNNKAFTLVELIVVITILAILGTIAFLSFQGYSKDSRNSVRLNDIGSMKLSLGLFQIKTLKYPTPDNYTNITYSGGLLWSEGIFGDNVLINLNNLSKKTLDPLLGVEYSYSVLNSGKKYQIGSIIEGDLLAGSSMNLINKVNAVSYNDIRTYITGNFEYRDIKVENGNGCIVLTTPSLFVSNSPSDGALVPSGNYNFVYNDSLNIPKNYENIFDNIIGGLDFQIKEVYNKCAIYNLSDLNYYLYNLSVAYQQYNGNPDYYDLIYNSNTNSFKVGFIDSLKERGINIPNNIINEIYNTIYNNFNDTFTGNDNDLLIGEHTSDTFGSWSGIIDFNSYIISLNNLKKTNSATGVIYPILVPPITSPDTTTTFKIVDFAGGEVTVYSRYVDDNNYYGVILSSSGYHIVKKLGGVLTTLGSTIETISPNSIIELTISGADITLFINYVEKENIIDGTINDIGIGAIEISAENGVIDDYNLKYK